ncbi:MAG: Ribonuclease J 1 [Parcubacteria group bacterium ADurb.Bin247]|nr:MAG: Ribonuclease J 1 [Parcubacteria group bacterium ADurb.Bin247]HQB84889.1 ribonuclease J [Candidatus Pacearchaeota archaeon]
MKEEKKLKIIPLGGMGEIGKNMTLFEYDQKILIVDIGLKMPSENMPGVDYIIPNVSYLDGREKDIVAVLFTHGHYDHIGAIPYIIEKIGNPKIFASPLTKGIIMKRQEEFPNNVQLDITEVNNGSKINLNPFKVEFFHMNHNIMHNLGMFIRTPVANIVHTSDFKLDASPVNEKPSDLEKLKEIGGQNIDLLMIDSTGAENPGHSLSEKVIMENLDEIFVNSNGRIIAATFSSLVNRIQQLIALSEKHGRKVAIIGNGMKTNIEICRKLKLVSIKKGTLIKPKDVADYPDGKITIICTGAQGEDRAALMRIANGEHQSIHFKKGDSVIFSSSVIPGNERMVQELKDDILRQGAKVYHYKMMDIHAGGHAYQDEIKEVINLIKPKNIMPIHGQYSMFASLKNMAIDTMNFKEENILLAENGDIVYFTKQKGTVEQSKIASNYVMVDGLGVGDVGEVVLRDRKMLAEDGMFVIIVIVDKQKGQVKGSPDIISRGFIYLRESKTMLFQTRKKTIQIVNKSAGSGGAVNWTYVKDELRNKIGQFLYEKTERRPMVLPVIIEV